MANYKKLSEYIVDESPSDGDLIPSIVDNGNGTYTNVLIPYSTLKGLPGTDGLGVPSGGSIGQVLAKTGSADNATAWTTMTLNKTAVGLSNVDNTSDLAKPVSTATQSAIDVAVAAAVASAISQSKQQSYPVGSLYFNADVATNPSTLLGFGTWVAHAEGRVPVGKAASGTFGTAGATGGAETHTLTWGQMPVHNHAQNVGANNGPGWRRDFQADAPAGTYSSGIYTDNAGGGEAHNNLQPYVVVYIWKRTA